MAVIKVSKHIDAPVPEVFRVMSDVPHWADHVSGITMMEMLTEGEIGVGTRFRETRKMFGKEHTEEMEITEFEPCHSYAVECESCGCHYRTTVEVRPDGTGSRVDMEMRTRPIGFMAKMMSPLGVLMKGSVRKCFQSDLDDVCRVVESTPVGSASPA
ncbi:MAG: SRPBCC family protein [Planctomycetota bacterium]|jgi:hypothetical protein